MIGQNLTNRFIMLLSDGWVYPEVEADLKQHFRMQGDHFRTALDYLNHTIVSGTLPGITDAGVGPQIYNQGENRTFAGSLKPSAIIDKELNVTFQLQNNFLNWILLYNQFLAYYDRKLSTNNNTGKESIFMPPVFMLILDEQDNIICRIEYKEIQFMGMPPLEFVKSNVGIDTKTFDVKLKFNDFKIDFFFNKMSQYTRKEFKY